MRRTLGTAIALVVILAAAPPAFAQEIGADSGAAPTSGEVDHVIAISVDGLRPDAITREAAPHITRMMREGMSTLNARNLVELTVTLPNHSSMFTGERVDVTEGGTGVVFNPDSGGTIHDSAGRYVSSVFDVVHDAGGETGLYVTKCKFDFFERSWHDELTDYVCNDPAETTAKLTRQLLSDDPFAFSFLHLRQPDEAGHEHSWGSAEYVAGVRDADRMVGRVLAAIDASPTLKNNTVVILTSDHGGHGVFHANRTDPLNYTVPFIVWGKGVGRGGDLYALNRATRLYPGAERPDYEGPQPIRNGEVANLATDLLDLPPVPGSLFDSAQDLHISGGRMTKVGLTAR